jgi:hypothetical protein
MPEMSNLTGLEKRRAKRIWNLSELGIDYMSSHDHDFEFNAEEPLAVTETTSTCLATFGESLDPAVKKDDAAPGAFEGPGLPNLPLQPGDGFAGRFMGL